MDKEAVEIINQFVSVIRTRNMVGPAVFMLEMYRPLTTLVYSVAQVSQPMYAPILGLEKTRLLMRLLEKREHVDYLIERLECDELRQES